LVLHVFGALAEFERGLMHERTIAGLIAARARRRVGGRPRALTAAQLAHAEAMAAAGTPVREIAEILGVGRSTVYRTLQSGARPGKRRGDE
jgi:DNA invertase Pin-like site-specific DNA recombinase